MGKQVRSENTYQKINTIFKRDANNIIMPYDEYVDPAISWLKDMKFDAEEKIDGTNIRIEVTQTPNYDNDEHLIGVSFDLKIKGKTDNAEIPKKLNAYLNEFFIEERVFNGLGIEKVIPIEKFGDYGWIKSKENPVPDYSKVPLRYTIYGEGYGAGIQKCGGNYSKDAKFIGFDVKVNDMYLLKENRDEVFNKMNCPIVPYMGQFTIQEAIDFVRSGFISKISDNREFMAEGLVLRTPIGLKNRRGERIITKIKYMDFVKYRNKYGTDEKVDQPLNPLNNN